MVKKHQTNPEVENKCFEHKIAAKFRHHKSYITNATPPLQSQLSGAIIKAGALLSSPPSLGDRIVHRLRREREREREKTTLAWK